MPTASKLVFAGLMLWLQRRSVPWRSLGFIRPIHWSPVCLAILFALAYAGVTLTIPEVRTHASEMSAFKFWGVLVSIVGAAVEETVLRGFILNELERIGGSLWIQVVVSGFTLGFVTPGFQLVGNLLHKTMGMALAVTYLWSGRSLLPPLISHALINIIVEPWLLVYAISSFARTLPDRPPDTPQHNA